MPDTKEDLTLPNQEHGQAYACSQCKADFDAEGHDWMLDSEPEGTVDPQVPWTLWKHDCGGDFELLGSIAAFVNNPEVLQKASASPLPLDEEIPLDTPIAEGSIGAVLKMVEVVHHILVKNRRGAIARSERPNEHKAALTAFKEAADQCGIELPPDDTVPQE